MKTKLIIIIPFVSLIGCAPEPKKPLPPVTADSYTVVLDPTNSTLTTDDSTSTISLSLIAKEDEEVIYELEIGAPCYLKNVSSYQEIIMKNGGFFRSKSNYKVDRLILDIYEGKGINYEVHNHKDGSGEVLEYHESTISPIYPEDSGAVYEYEINSTEWSITNTTVYKPAFYSVTIVFEIE